MFWLVGVGGVRLGMEGVVVVEVRCFIGLMVVVVLIIGLVAVMIVVVGAGLVPCLLNSTSFGRLSLR